MTITRRTLIVYWLWLAVLVLHIPAAFILGVPALITFHAWLCLPWVIGWVKVQARHWRDA